MVGFYSIFLNNGIDIALSAIGIKKRINKGNHQQYICQKITGVSIV